LRLELVLALGRFEHQAKNCKAPATGNKLLIFWRAGSGVYRGLAMSFLLLHLVAGLLAGAFFRIQTLITLALLVLIEVVSGLGTSGVAFLALWCFAAETMLQLGYLAGVFARSIYERSDLAFRFTNGPSTR
jgi:hypothetical protein